MKYFILILTVFISTLNAQVNTFEKSYSNFMDGNNSGYMSFSLDGEGYLICGRGSLNQFNSDTSTGLILIKTDLKGFSEWYRVIDEDDIPYASTRNIMVTDDKKILVVTNKTTVSSSNVVVTKFDINGIELWSKTLIENEDLYGLAVLESKDKDYFIVSANLHRLNILKTDSAGSILWNKDFFIDVFVVGHVMITRWGDGYAISKAHTILKMSENGDSLLTITESPKSIRSGKDGSLIVGYVYKLKIYNSDGSLRSEKHLNKNILEFDIRQDGGYNVLFNDKKTIQIVDSTGMILSEKVYSGNLISISSTIDGGILLAGYFIVNSIKKIYAIKTNGSGEVIAIHFYSPELSDPLFIFNDYQLTWHSNNVHFVDIEYSTNNGGNWQTIVENFPSDSGMYYWQDPFYNWTVPYTPSESLIIRISDVNDRSIYDQSDIPGSVIYYQQYDEISPNETKMWIWNDGTMASNPAKVAGYYPMELPLRSFQQKAKFIK